MKSRHIKAIVGYIEDLQELGKVVGAASGQLMHWLKEMVINLVALAGVVGVAYTIIADKVGW